MQMAEMHVHVSFVEGDTMPLSVERFQRCLARRGHYHVRLRVGITRDRD